MKQYLSKFDENINKVNLIGKYTTDIGNLECFEGEIMKISLRSVNAYNVGDFLSCLYKHKSFETRVLKKTKEHLYLYVPEILQLHLEDKRKYVRVKVDNSSTIKADNNEYFVKLVDLSINGFGFVFEEDVLGLKNEYTLISPLHKTIEANIIIRNKKIDDLGIRYGAEISNITKENLHELRKYVLLQQLQK